VLGLLTFLKAIAVMFLAAFGAGALYSGLARTTYDVEFSVGFGVFCLLGAFFLYRA
jgi:hypothetical protein